MTQSHRRLLHTQPSHLISCSPNLLFHTPPSSSCWTGHDLDLPRGVTYLAPLDRALGPRPERARARGHLRRYSRALYAHNMLILVHLSPHHSSSGQSHIRHCTEISAGPLLATSSALKGTMLPLAPGTLTHNITGVPTIVARTKADLIDDHPDLVGARVSGMGGMVNRKGGDWEERRRDHADTGHNLLKMCASLLHLLLVLMT